MSIVDDAADIARRLKDLQEGKEQTMEDEKPKGTTTTKPDRWNSGAQAQTCPCGLDSSDGACSGACCG